MANFFLIDQSLQKLGGHHYDYVRCVASAANQQGFKTTIGTGGRFRGDDLLANLGTVRRTFRQTTYHADSYLSGLRHLTRSTGKYLNEGPKKRSYSIGASVKSMTRKFHLLRHKSRRDKNIRAFAQDCQRFFSNQTLTDTDHAFFTTVNEMELMGLAAFLSNHPRTIQVSWHLQFHFNLFEGRTPEYQSQNKVARAVQRCFDAALARVPYHKINFYTTSETLADQFNRLKVGRFETLAYPIRPELFQKTEASRSAFESNHRPLKITCPGEVRREKKFIEYLQPLVDKIWDRHLASGNVQLVLQRPKEKRGNLKKLATLARIPLRKKIELRPPEYANIGGTNEQWVNYFDHPLSDDDYLKLINDADIGLLFYDSRAYFSRRAGVLGELLSCGKPVIVPAGSWLADQIQEPIFRHAERLLVEHGTGRDFGLESVSWTRNNVPLAGDVVSFNQKNPFTFEFELQEDENAFAIEFDWHWPRERGVYCRLVKTELDDESGISSTGANAVQVVGHRDHEQPAICFFKTTGRKIRLELLNAFHESTANVKNLMIRPLSLSAGGCSISESESMSSAHVATLPVPMGAVGVIAADEHQIADAVDEIVSHFKHYQQSADDFSKRWCMQHEPRRTVSHLVSPTLPVRKAS